MTGLKPKPVDVPDFSDIPGAMNEATNDIVKSVMDMKERFVKQKLIEKGYGHLVDDLKQMRFPKINISTKGEWEYIFVDNGSVQGNFIVALRVVTGAFSPLSPTEIKASIEWQDADFEAVRIPEI